MTKRLPPLTTIALLVIAALLAGCAQPDKAPSAVVDSGGPADFGDAPDGAPTGYAAPFEATGRFPTTRASDGARTLDTTAARLGQSASAEDDAKFPDDDDGIVDMVLVLSQMPPPAALTVRASAPDASAGGKFFLNVLVDRDLDGRWAGADWVVRNVEVELSPGDSKNLETPPFAITDSLVLPESAWMRVALTSEAAPDGWTGTGVFAAGEVEDHVLKLPTVDGKHPAIAQMTCAPATVVWPEDDPTVDVGCTIRNVAPAGHGDQIRWDMTRASGGVDVTPTGDLVVIAPGDSLDVVVTAKRGDMPSTWRYKAVGVDPPSRVTADGVEIGHGESEGAVQFEEPEGKETALACAILIAEIETSREHRAGESDAIFWIYVKQHGEREFQRALNASITGTVDAPGNPTVEATADAEGFAEVRHTVHAYGDYTLTVTDVALEGCEWDAEASQTEATAAVQPD